MALKEVASREEFHVFSVFADENLWRGNPCELGRSTPDH
jgi:hypothetical protein